MVKKLLGKGRKAKQEKKNKIIVIILLIIILFLVIFLVINLTDLSVLEKKEIYAKIIVSDHYGFDLNGTALTFGMVRPGGTSSRALILENKYNKEVEVEIYAKGKIKEFILISDNNFILRDNEKKELSFTVSVPSGTEYGNYTGFVIMKFRKEGCKLKR